MADERDFELLDDYLTNRMSDADRSAFEQKLKADPDLQHEYTLQKRLIEGIKEARIAELKSMLNNVPVPATGSGTLAAKIIIGTIATLLIAGAAFWFLREDNENTGIESAKEEQAPAPQRLDTQPAPEPAEDEQEESQLSTPQSVEADKNQTSAGTEHSKPSLAKKPDPLAAPGEKNDRPVLDVFTPENEDSSAGNVPSGDKNALTPASPTLIVETDRDNRRYTFHYQFRDGKLFLYGPFERNLYEIMEFFAGEKRTVFLYYKDYYYLLPEADEEIRPLTAITDPALLRKLRQYRESK